MVLSAEAGCKSRTTEVNAVGRMLLLDVDAAGEMPPPSLFKLLLLPLLFAALEVSMVEIAVGCCAVLFCRMFLLRDLAML